MSILVKTNITVTGYDLLTSLDKIIANADINPGSFLILIDKTISDLYKDKILKSLSRLDKPLTLSIIEAGERQKDILKIPNIIKPFFAQAFDRKSCLVSIGGGVVSDIGGVLSSIMLRGISSIFMPTTLLAQIDAAIGGKNGVDLFIENGNMLKNMLGTFKQPDLVICDVKFLKTLPEHEIISGLGEMAKYYLGWGTPSKEELMGFRDLIKSNNWKGAGNIIHHCQKIKTAITLSDPFEQSGIRQKLNLGHTIGHAVEAVANGELSHGQAVGIGLIAAAKISLLKGLLPENKFAEIRNTILQLGLPVSVSNINKNAVLNALKFDKKDGTFILIKDIGKIIAQIDVEQHIIKQALDEIII